MSGFSALVTPVWVQILGGWRALGFAALATAAVAWGGWQKWKYAELHEQTEFLWGQVQLLNERRIAAEALAADQKARADAAVAAEQAERAARQAEASVRARKWKGITERQKAWSEQEVPDEVWIGLDQ